MAIRDWLPDDRPREKLLRHGASVLSDAELLAILFRTGAGRGHSAIDLARAVLTELGGIHGLAAYDPQSLCRIHGVGPVKAMTLVAAVEFARRWMAPPRADAPICDSSRAIYDYYGPRLLRRPHEELLLLSLDARLRVIREDRVALGDVRSATVPMRGVFVPAVAAQAVAIVLLHNHPSGVVQPSEADATTTQRIAEAGSCIGIPLLDHLIIGEGNYFSFRDAGKLD